MSFNLLVLTCLAYVALLFAVASVAERSAEEGRAGWLRSPLVYTLSLFGLLHGLDLLRRGRICGPRSGAGIYDNLPWPDFGIRGLVGDAAQTGAHWPGKPGHIHPPTSSRRAMANRILLGVIVTLLCISAGTPLYRAATAIHRGSPLPFSRPIWTAPPVAGDRSFDRTFGWRWAGVFSPSYSCTRNLDANEQHLRGRDRHIRHWKPVVKLGVALLAVGISVVLGRGGWPGRCSGPDQRPSPARMPIQPGRWTGAYLLLRPSWITDPAAHVSGAGGRKCGRQASGTYGSGPSRPICSPSPVSFCR